MQEVLNDFLRNKTVLVTGGGGSIGSELCRQIAKFNVPKTLFLIAEVELFSISGTCLCATA